MAEKTQGEFGGEDPFAAFKTGQALGAPTPQASATEPEATAKTKRSGRPRKPKPEGNGSAKESPAVLMVPVTAMGDLVELDPDQIKLFTAVAGKISELPKGRAKHLVAALSKLFG